MSAISSRLSLLPLLAAAAAAAAAHRSDQPAPSPWDIAVRTCVPRIPAPLQNHGRFGCPALLDEETARARGPAAWSPWTHAPVCTTDTNATNITTADGQKQQPKQKFCVYTNSRHGIGGMSVITTPEAASVSIDLLNEEMPRLRKSMLNTATVDKGNNNDNNTQPAYEIVDLPGKGKGVLATRRIAQYEVFMVDYAALVVDMQVPETVAREEGYRLLSLAAAQVSDPSRVLDLAQTSTAARNPVENVLRSNAFDTLLGGEEASHMALFPDLARINHACKPNAYPSFLQRSLAVSVAAARDIEPGEEITISYIPLGLTRAARQSTLLRWEFVCECPLCAASADEVRVSDERRTQIEEMRRQVAEAAKERTPQGTQTALDITRDLFARVREEELFTAYSEQYANVGRLYWALGDRDQAAFYAQRALDTMAEQGFIAPADRHNVHILLRSYDEG